VVPLGRAGPFLLSATPRRLPQVRVRSLDANLGSHRVTHVLRFSGGAAFDRVDSTSLTSPSWIRQGATHPDKSCCQTWVTCPRHVLSCLAKGYSQV
jgi:hypothetical protein